MTASQAPFESRFIWFALGLALLAGFALGAHVIAVIGYGFPLGKGFYAYIQSHGHLQLIGWIGLFVIGISLHFIPRLTGSPLKRPGALSFILYSIGTGLILRYLCHAFLPYVTGHWTFMPLTYFLVVSGLLEWLGIATYLTLLIRSVTGHTTRDKLPVKNVRPFILMMFAGWGLYATLNLILLANMALDRDVTVHQAWNEFAMQAFIQLTILPVIFAFSIRLFPLYLRLPAVTWSTFTLAAVYLVASVAILNYLLPPISLVESHWPLKASGMGYALKGSVILVFIWKLDLLTRRRLPWTDRRIGSPGPERRPTRPGLPDYGEFGRFEWLVYAAFTWLALGALLDLIGGLARLFDFSFAVSYDAIRHIYLLGFASQLIMGMAPRMIPGFLHQKKVAIPGLVSATFWLVNLSALGRTLPLLFPYDLIQSAVLTAVLQNMLAWSGIFGMAAVLCLAINLGKTHRQKNAK